jgi:hypothetical protein
MNNRVVVYASLVTILSVACLVGCKGGADYSGYIDHSLLANPTDAFWEDIEAFKDFMQGEWDRTDITVAEVTITLGEDGTYEIDHNNELADAGTWEVEDCGLVRRSNTGIARSFAATPGCNGQTKTVELEYLGLTNSNNRIVERYTQPISTGADCPADDLSSVFCGEE